MTKRIPYARRADAFQTIIERHSDYLSRDSSARRFLLKRQLTLAAKAGELSIDLRTVAGLSTLELWLMLGYHHALRITLAAKRAKASE